MTLKMSTKATISYGSDYHFYEECFDRSNVYLQLEGAEFEANDRGVMVRIPIKIWREIFESWGKDGWPVEEDEREAELAKEWIQSLESLSLLRGFGKGKDLLEANPELKDLDESS